MAGPRDDVPTVDAGGASIPRVGLGTWELRDEECADIVETALERGYRHLDTAQEYENEAAVGEGLAAADVDRKDVFLTTKVKVGNLHYDDVIDSVHESIDRLNVDAVDLLLIHGPHPRVNPREPLAAMNELREAGRVEHLGVSNFSRDHLRMAMAHSDAPIVTNQVLYHPYRDQSALLEFCEDNDVALTAYSPLAQGAVVDDKSLVAIGDRYGKTAAQVALRWLVQQEGVVAIPKTAKPEHLDENQAIFDFELTDDEVARVNDLRPDLRQRLAYAGRGAALRFISFVWRHF